MAITTYNFVGITSPSSTHKAYESNTSSLPGATGGAEASQSQYDAAEASDDNRWSYSEEESGRPWHRFEFKIAEAAGDITQIKGLHEGYAGVDNDTTEDSLHLYIRNFNSGTWELLASHTNSTDTTISGVKTADIAHYLNGDNYVFLLAYEADEPEGGQWSFWMVTDYVEVEITYEETGAEQLAIRFNPFGIKRFGGF